MITEKIGSLNVERYDDIEEMLVKNYNIFNECALYDSNIGSLNAVYSHFQKVDYFIAAGKPEDALQARKNLNEVFVHIFAHNNFPALQWASTIDKIDDQKITDYSIDGLNRLIDRLSAAGLTQKKVKADVEALKKKLITN